MDDDDRPLSRGTGANFGAASLLAGEGLDRYSLDELDSRIALLEAEIARVAEHRRKAAAHRSAADLLFGSKPA
ncbi:MAG: DUF1192 domain-containing protein [Novosphingobium sp.]